MLNSAKMISHVAFVGLATAFPVSLVAASDSRRP